jgi:hypothetical protein
MTTAKIVSPTPLKKGLEGIPEGLPPEEVERLQKLQAKLTDFILHIIQALLRTGYYTQIILNRSRRKKDSISSSKPFRTRG